MDDPTSFLLAYDTYESVTTPDFSGTRVDSYLKLRDITSHLQHFNRAFANLKDNDVSFELFPPEFDTNKLEAFTHICYTDGVKELFKSAKVFQTNTTMRWNPTANEPTLSIYLELIGIDKAASKECSPIKLDLLLRAGVLISNEDGSWLLMDD